MIVSENQSIVPIDFHAEVLDECVFMSNITLKKKKKLKRLSKLLSFFF